MSEPLLSVCLITYNHVNFIRAAVDGVLMQRVSFPWELIIADDFSTDGTREIILEYKNRFPEFIKLILQERNIGAADNFRDLITAPSSKYIAYFEGDDYWTDPLKLQKQVDFLESHPECSMCFHAFERLEDNRLSCVCYPPERRQIYTLDDFLRCTFIGTMTVVYRRGLFGDFPDWYFRMPQGDFGLHVLNAQHGDIGYIDDVMAVYRVHSGGAWSMVEPTEISKRLLVTYKIIGGYLGHEYERTIDDVFSALHSGMAQQLLRKKDLWGALLYMGKCLLVTPLRNSNNKMDVIYVFLQTVAPRLLQILKKIKSSIEHWLH